MLRQLEGGWVLSTGTPLWGVYTRPMCSRGVSMCGGLERGAMRWSRLPRLRLLRTRFMSWRYDRISLTLAHILHLKLCSNILASKCCTLELDGSFSSLRYIVLAFPWHFVLVNQWYNQRKNLILWYKLVNFTCNFLEDKKKWHDYCTIIFIFTQDDVIVRWDIED